jgi:hypothetical protein
MKNTFMFRGHVACMRRETVHSVLRLGNMKERGTSQDISVDRRIFKTWDADLDRICLTLCRDMWTALVNTVINFRFLQDGRNFLIAGRFVGFSRRTLLHEVSCFIRVGQYDFLRKGRAQRGGD